MRQLLILIRPNDRFASQGCTADTRQLELTLLGYCLGRAGPVVFTAYGLLWDMSLIRCPIGALATLLVI